MAIDVKALRKTMNEVERAAKRRSGSRRWTPGTQESYRCKTGMCFAGHGLALTDARWAHPKATDSFADDLTTAPSKWFGVADCREVMEVHYGLTEGEADTMFDANNDLNDLRFMVLAIETIAALDPEAVQ